MIIKRENQKPLICVNRHVACWHGTERSRLIAYNGEDVANHTNYFNPAPTATRKQATGPALKGRSELRKDSKEGRFDSIRIGSCFSSTVMFIHLKAVD